jgi:ribose transport system substrate-binding protein
MKSIHHFSVLILTGALLALIPACGGKGGNTASAGKTKVAIVTNCTAEFWSICEAGAMKASKDLDVEVSFRQPATNTVADQSEIVDAEIKRGISGIAISVINPLEQNDKLKLIAKSTNFLAMDNDAPESNRKCYIGIDNYEAGKAVGRLIKKAMPNGGTVSLFIGTLSSANSKARSSGVLDELAEKKDAPSEPGSQLGKYKLDAIHLDDTNEAKAQDKAKDVLEKLKDTPNLCMVGLYAYNPKAILLAARAKGLVGKVKIVGFDEDWTTLEGIAKGDIVGTVVQDPFNYGYMSVKVLAGLAKGDANAAKIDPIAYRVITKDGGSEETINGVKVQNVKAQDFEAKLRADLSSVKK